MNDIKEVHPADWSADEYKKVNLTVDMDAVVRRAAERLWASFTEEQKNDAIHIYCSPSGVERCRELLADFAISRKGEER